MNLELTMLISLVIGFVVLGIIIFFSLNSFFSIINSKIDRILNTTDEVNQTLRKIQELMENSKPIIYNFQEITSNIKKITNNIYEVTSDISFITRKGRGSLEAIEKLGNQGLQKLIEYVQRALKGKKDNR